jgi:hypothetical protein
MTSPERPTDPAWSPSSASVEPSPTEAAGGTTPIAARLPTSPGKKPSASNSRVVNLVLGLAGIVAIGGVGFATGRLTAPTPQAAQFGNGQFQGGGQLPGGGSFPPGFGDGQGGGFVGGGFRSASVLEGTIVAVTSDSLTLRIGNAVDGGQGTEIVIPLSTATAVHTQASASSGDLASGQTVLVQLGTPAAGSTAAPVASGAPSQIQAAASDVTILTP